MEKYERRAKEIEEKPPIEELEKEMQDWLGVDSAKILSCKIRTEIIEE